MGVRKFRSVEQMSPETVRPRLDPGNLRLALGLSSLASGLNPIRLVPGVGRYRSQEDALSARAKPMRGRSSCSLAESYRRLEDLVRTVIPEGVTYRLRLSPEEIEAGWFDPEPYGVPPPQIVLYRPRHQDESGDVLHEVLTLAHELGHYRSFDKGLRTPEYAAAIKVPWQEWPDLSRRDRCSILEEERRAWQFAREILGEVGFSDWDAFWRRHQESLADYRARLRLDL